MPTDETSGVERQIATANAGARRLAPWALVALLLVGGGVATAIGVATAGSAASTGSPGSGTVTKTASPVSGSGVLILRATWLPAGYGPDSGTKGAPPGGLDQGCPGAPVAYLYAARKPSGGTKSSTSTNARIPVTFTLSYFKSSNPTDDSIRVWALPTSALHGVVAPFGATSLPATTVHAGSRSVRLTTTSNSLVATWAEDGTSLTAIAGGVTKDDLVHFITDLRASEKDCGATTTTVP